MARSPSARSPKPNAPRGSAGHGRRLRAPGVLVAIVLLVGVPAVLAYILLTEESDAVVSLDADLCPTGAAAVSGHAVLLLDLRKPLGRGGNLAADALRAVDRRLGVGEELRVFTVTADPVAPRMRVERLCKPYDDADLQVAAAKDADGIRDCHDLPAQIPRGVRERATRFCARLEVLARRVAVLAAENPVTPVANAYLIEAIEDTLADLADAPNPSLYIFSDMVQHSPWYSHVERGPNEWGFDEFAGARAQRTEIPLSVAPPPNPYLGVHVFYVRRLGLTDQPRIARAHRQFWQGYFADVASLEFDDYPVTVSYEVQREGPTDDEIAAENARQELEQARQQLAQAEQEKADLEAARQRAEEEAREAELRRRELEAEATARQEADEPAEEEAEPPTPPLALGGNDADPDEPDADTLAQAPDPGGEEPAIGEEEPQLDRDEPQLDAQPPAALATADDLTASPQQPDAPFDNPPNPCVATLRPGFAEAASAYPNRGFVNYGSADIVVAYTVDDGGQTVDHEVAFVPEESDAERPGRLDLFRRSAEESVRTWVFDFDEADDCVKRQRKLTRISFRYRR